MFQRHTSPPSSGLKSTARTAYSLTMKMLHRRKEEYGKKPRSCKMTRTEEEVYKNGNVRGRNMLKNAQKDKHTGECKDRQ